MKTNSRDTVPGMPTPQAGMVVEAVTTYEEVPVVTDAQRAELLASLVDGEADAPAGRARRMSIAQFRAEIRDDFEAITGYRAR